MSDCEDSSDEKNCKLVIMDDDYQMEDAPMNSDSNGTNVFVSFTVFDLNSFHEISMSYQIKFTITLKWYDSRLIYANLQNGTEFKNKLGKAERDQIWIPQLFISNSLDLKFIELDGISSITVQQWGSFEMNSLTETTEKRLFKGAENALIYRNTYEIELHCDFDLYNYPFDKQHCKIQVSD